jgi:peroxiredoxin
MRTQNTRLVRRSITGLFQFAFVCALALAVHVSFASVSIGHQAPAFSLPNAVTGATVTLASLEQGKKAVVVMFISTRCPVSNAYDDRMAALATTYAAKGVAVVGINSNQTEPLAEVSSHAKSHNFPFPVLKDSDSSVADLYNANSTPETYVIDSKGALVYHGRIDNSQDPGGVVTHDLADAINSVLDGKPVAKPETKAFGCSIKR